MSKQDQIDQITLIAQAGKAIALSLSADDQFKCLPEKDIAAILYDLLCKFE